ncbi:hypothetical protein BKA67DRAFT_662413 [Truncatella angustata]|uniref:DUF6604 domain-containing protein n=1 Tax=Truncatella angustata TaxID=152316 RepID=A0A9P8RQM2_9PEZI|nr:uncharacterized protein BKA67DRAFT_662413 [Truncatella angustata]KAH6647638.1 hypothetical protein BKA67DRAFT_662413 [Truncatella angustata]
MASTQKLAGGNHASSTSSQSALISNQPETCSSIQTASEVKGPKAADDPPESVYVVSTAEIVEQVNTISHFRHKEMDPEENTPSCRRRYPYEEEMHGRPPSSRSSRVQNRHKEPVQIPNAKSTNRTTYYVSNAFSGFEIEHPPSDDEGDKLQAPIVHGGSQEPVAYDAAVSKASEFDLMAYTFLEDLHYMRAEVKSIWLKFRKEEVDLKQATVLTSICLDLSGMLKRNRGLRPTSQS